jgi:site-specific recombinase XerD
MNISEHPEPETIVLPGSQTVGSLPGKNRNPALPAGKRKASEFNLEKINEQDWTRRKIQSNKDKQRLQDSSGTNHNKDKTSYRIEQFRKFLAQHTYDQQTIQQYLSSIKRFAESRDLSSIDNTSEIKDYLFEMSIKKGYSKSYQDQFINALKAYLKLVHGREAYTNEINRPHRSLKSPVLLSEEEMSRILKNIPNLKHFTLIMLIMNTGISVSEVVRLRLTDLDMSKMTLTVTGKQGKRKRILPLKHELIHKMEEYLYCFQPIELLFEGHNHTGYSERMVQKLIKKYSEKAGIYKKANVQVIRNTYAVGLFATGRDKFSVKKIMGFKSIKNTYMFEKLAV